MEWQARQPRDSNNSFPCAALPSLCLGKESVSADCQMKAEMALIWSSLRRKFGILVVARKSLGFLSHTGTQFLLSLRRMSLRLGPTFFMSCRRLLVERSSWTTRRSSLLFVTVRETARSLRWLASSLLSALSACFLKSPACLLLSFFSCSICLICCATESRSSGSLS